MTTTHIVPKIPTAQRLQEYGVGIFAPIPTKSALKKALKKKYLTVNGHIATTATLIHGGELIRLTLPKDTPSVKPFHLKIDILYEDEYLALVHKPAGILVSGNSFKTMTNALVQNLRTSTQPDATQPQPVHRLDFATTGILMVGKTGKSIRTLNLLFEKKAITKVYYAVTIGAMDKKGTITARIDGKPSHSSYNLLKSVPSVRFGQLNLVELLPQTGRRHQLRKHLAGIDNPILGDPVYGTDHLILKGKGLYLHAYSLRFKHPFTQKEFFLTDGLPQRFKKLFPKAT